MTVATARGSSTQSTWMHAWPRHCGMERRILARLIKTKKPNAAVRTIDEKLKTLDDLYQILRSDQNNRTMLILEWTIVLLFVIDLVILIMGLKK